MVFQKELTGKLVFGVGINDIPNICKEKVYTTWHSMLRRCYSIVYQKNKQKYIGCQVSEEWKTLSNFKRWFDENYSEGWQLDKDLLVKGNKVYSKETCCFIPKEINACLISCSHKDAGVTYNKRLDKWIAQLSKLQVGSSRTVHIGVYLDKKDALAAYSYEKNKYLIEISSKYKLPKHVEFAILNYG